jgi:hypothetical protein
MPAIATIRIYERSCPADDFDTESGQGMPDDVEPYETDTIEVADDDDAIQAALNDHGLGQWDGGSTAYDPDGSHMAADAAGTITERYASVEH